MRGGARIAIELPLGGSRSTLLDGLSCNSAVAGMAVGDFVDNLGAEQILAEQYS